MFAIILFTVNYNANFADSNINISLAQQMAFASDPLENTPVDKERGTQNCVKCCWVTNVNGNREQTSSCKCPGFLGAKDCSIIKCSVCFN